MKLNTFDAVVAEHRDMKIHFRKIGHDAWPSEIENAGKEYFYIDGVAEHFPSLGAALKFCEDDFQKSQGAFTRFDVFRHDAPDTVATVTSLKPNGEAWAVNKDGRRFKISSYERGVWFRVEGNEQNLKELKRIMASEQVLYKERMALIKSMQATCLEVGRKRK